MCYTEMPDKLKTSDGEQTKNIDSELKLDTSVVAFFLAVAIGSFALWRVLVDPAINIYTAADASLGKVCRLLLNCCPSNIRTVVSVQNTIDCLVPNSLRVCLGGRAASYCSGCFARFLLTC